MGHSPDFPWARLTLGPFVFHGSCGTHHLMEGWGNCRALTSMYGAPDLILANPWTFDSAAHEFFGVLAPSMRWHEIWGFTLPSRGNQ